MRIEEAKWRRNNLTYYINGWVGDGISQADQRAILAQAWKSWTDVCDLRIEETNNKNSANIIIDVGNGRRDNFDGPGGTLAWAYLPDGRDGQLLMRFDMGETWVSSYQKRGVRLLNVAAHEFGHLLGLGHSKKQGALMAPYYNANIAAPVHNDDVTRIVGLYGKPVLPNPPGPTTPPAPTPTPTPTNGEVTTITIVGNISQLDSTGHLIFKKN